MHAQSPAVRGGKMDASGEREDCSKAGDPCGFCKCGCGQQVFRDSRGRIRKYHTSCKKNSGPRLDWETRFTQSIENAPLCKCGCAEKVKTPFRDAADMRAHRGRSYPKFLLGHDKRPKGHGLKLNHLEQSAILGTLLGDGSISYPNKRSKNARLAWTHGECQAGWVYHKAAALWRLNPVVRFAPSAGYGETSVRMHTSCLPSISTIYSIVHDGTRKRVTREWLERLGDVGMAWWFCDDGHWSGTMFFHTEGYSEKENKLIADWIGQASIDHNQKGQPYIRVKKRRALEIMGEIKPHIPECMAYKIPVNHWD